MNQHGWTRLGFGVCGLLAILALAACSDRRERPNVILIVTDDQGYADLSCQGIVEDVKTPHIDRLAKGGVLMTSGYATAPQCVPSRAAVLTGRYQNRFGIEVNADGPLLREVTTIAQRLQKARYATGVVGKGHLEPDSLAERKAQRVKREILTDRLVPYTPRERGFTDYFVGSRSYGVNYDLDGNDLGDGRTPVWFNDTRLRIDMHSDAAVTFIKRRHEQPFFLYLAYDAPHMPLEATEDYLARFPEQMPTRRRYALAMISAMDDGVGRIMATLREYGLEENTLIFFVSDHGASLHKEKKDEPIEKVKGSWNGSLNDPWLGEKRTLLEGGIRVPFIAYWKGVLPQGMVYHHPVTTMDASATALAVAGLPLGDHLDGVNLIPFLTGENDAPPHDHLFWRWNGQAAVRSGQWKYLRVGSQARFLFDLSSDEHEHRNLITDHPERAADLAGRLEEWAEELSPPGLEDGLPNDTLAYYRHYLKNHNW